MAPPVERALPATVLGRGTALQQFYLTGEDNLRVEVRNVDVAGPVLIAGRFWSEAERRVQVFAQNYDLGVPADSRTLELKLPAGSLLNLRIGTTATSSFVLGTVFARAQIIRGLGATAVVLATILQGYFSRGNDLGWPGSPIQTEHDGRGRLVAQGWTYGGAPVQATATVNTGQRWRVSCGAVLFATSAVAGDRQVFVMANDASAVRLYHRMYPVNIPASTAVALAFGAGASSDTTLFGGLGTFSWPEDLELDDGATVGFQAQGALAGDVFSGGRVYTRQWFDT